MNEPDLGLPEGRSAAGAVLKVIIALVVTALGGLALLAIAQIITFAVFGEYALKTLLVGALFAVGSLLVSTVMGAGRR
jgi:hypothetical protein